jgi:hypothetical protein
VSDVALAGVEATAVMTPQVAANGSQDLNGLRESFRTFRLTPPVAANGSQDLNGLRESFRTFRRGIAGHRPLQVSQA